ncbi:MAG TPA: sugar phosphate isomerase/epimerase [Candidatus Hydrogenedentes bacterium]|nr:sugar phosphate isomerase/epimerase [Candidatus Hydrogenedentota bacterium]HPG67729.1 sugar phosphate isomerase/epimerase [Candidatus Hydrogenedentota bacterium]
MNVGMLTAPFAHESLDTVMDFAVEVGIASLEVIAHPGSKHIDPSKLTAAQVARVRDAVERRGLAISSLAFYTNTVDPKNVKAVQAHAKKCIDVAVHLNVNTVCMLAGMPLEGMSKIDTIRNVCPDVFRPILAHARKKNVNIALENYFATCLQGLDTFECLFLEAIPDANFGLNYDPSHLVHQQCDHLVPVSMMAGRIFHTHAKDTLVDKAKRAKVGIYGGGWWRYVIPGFGNIDWGEYIAHLRAIRYDDVLSIEHEDGSQTREEGFARGARYLSQFC